MKWSNKRQSVNKRIFERYKFSLILVFILIFELFNFNSISQNVGINPTGAAAQSSAGLDVDFTNKGMLLPRLTTAQRDLIGSPVAGLLIYNIDCTELNLYTGSSWVDMDGVVVTGPPSAAVANAATNITQTTFDANWTAVSGATTYFLDVDDNSDFSSPLAGFNNLDVGNVTTYNVTGLTCNTTYYYRLRASNGCGSGANSNTITSTTSACAYVCPGTGTFVDARDGRTYGFVDIGAQRWMCQNLDFGTYVTVATGQGGAGTQKYCYGDNTTNCETYGGLYEWTEMMNGSAACNGTGAPPNDECATVVQGICPAGWHVPSHFESTTMERNVGSNPGAFPYDGTIAWLGTDEGGNLKQTGTTLWTTPNTGATNSSGFTALPGGLYSIGYSQNGSYGHWWTSSAWNGSDSWYRAVGFNTSQIAHDHVTNNSGLPVRCVQD